MAYIDYSSDSNSTNSIKNILEDDNTEFEISLADVGKTNTITLTASTLKTLEKQFETSPSTAEERLSSQLMPPLPLPSPLPIPAPTDNKEQENSNIEKQLLENNNMALVYGLAENLEILRSMNEEICERLDWVTQQTQQITDQFNEDREEARRERKRDRILGMGFSILETTLFIVGIIYATVLFLIEMYYSVNFGII